MEYLGRNFSLRRDYQLQMSCSICISIFFPRNWQNNYLSLFQWEHLKKLQTLRSQRAEAAHSLLDFEDKEISKRCYCKWLIYSSETQRLRFIEQRLGAQCSLHHRKTREEKLPSLREKSRNYSLILLSWGKSNWIISKTYRLYRRDIFHCPIFELIWPHPLY